ncbi:TauD/TfdA dioxygenase family protein [Paraburkholderia aspalathi]|uniref:Taurine dioxygenase n=1 Tax=Paraburkholderia aspalathi TaxID=1324617 RepID=A0A1I7ERL8_9BURK|nr:TauD/TfdA family dioxygenase [Paraburkholderia aspalathi]SFU26562.1 taurine dioxygenase [Paraburkholderia aspalathi]
MKITPSPHALGAMVEDFDLGQPLSDASFAALKHALGKHGVLWYPRQQLEAAQLKRFAEHFGTLEINVANSFQEPGIPEVMVLSNIVRDGKPIGLADAGQSWHTDMSYSRTIAFTNILYGIEVPFRDGRPLGNTEFCNMHAAYDDLPTYLKTLLNDKTIEHDFNKFWEMMRREKGSSRPPLTAEQRAAKPPVSHPVFLTHPITKRRVLYANPGYAMRVNGMPEDESGEILDYLFKHQVQDKYRYKHPWSVGDVLMWDNIGTIHNAVADYRPDEHRLIKRCQVIADKVFAEVM